MSPRSCLFWAIRQIIHTRMNSFGQQLPSQRQLKPEPKSGNHQMPPTLHVLSYEKTGLRGSQKEHMLARKTSAALFVSANWCRWSGCRWVEANRRWEGACGCRDNSRPSPWEESRRPGNMLRYTGRGKLPGIRLQLHDIYKQRWLDE